MKAEKILGIVNKYDEARVLILKSGINTLHTIKGNKSEIINSIVSVMLQNKDVADLLLDCGTYYNKCKTGEIKPKKQTEIN